jgi:hypothetical protein
MRSTDQTGWEAVDSPENSKAKIFEKEEEEESNKHQVWLSSGGK